VVKALHQVYIRSSGVLGSYVVASSLHSQHLAGFDTQQRRNSLLSLNRIETFGKHWQTSVPESGRAVNTPTYCATPLPTAERGTYKQPPGTFVCDTV
jgi:hypothetical protein